MSALRMSTAPPLAVDRLVGLSGVSKSFVANLENGKISKQASPQTVDTSLNKICEIVAELLDQDLFSWIGVTENPLARDIELAATVVADRLCGAIANPIVRNAQEKRQLDLIETWLLERGYVKKSHPSSLSLRSMQPGTFSFRQNVIVGSDRNVNIPVDVVIQPHEASSHGFPYLIEAKSAGDFTNTNKRRKEEAQKLNQLRATYGNDISLTLFLCGYFDGGYLGYSATEGLDWIWEHRIEDLEKLGV
jgi:transcriptional regulator with XRE-family HTH domain